MTAGLVGQNQITTFTTPVNGTSPIDANQVRGNDNTIKTSYDLHDLDGTIHFQSSLAAARPAAGTAGRKWINSDTLRVYYDNGVTWDEIAYLPSGGGTISGNVHITGTLLVDGATTIDDTLTITGIGTFADASGWKATTADVGVYVSGGELALGKYSSFLGLKIATTGAATFSSSITAGSSIFAGAAAGLGFSARGHVLAQSDGVWTLLNNAETDFSRLQFGGATSSFPALKRSTNEMHVVLADDSGFAGLRTNSIVSNGTVTGTRHIGSTDVTNAVAFGTFSDGTGLNAGDASVTRVLGTLSTIATSDSSNGTDVAHFYGKQTAATSSNIKAGSFVVETSNTSGTVSLVVGVLSTSFSSGNGGTTTGIDMFRTGGSTISSGHTVTQWRGLNVVRPTVSGTLTTLIGVDIGDMTTGSTNFALRTGSGTVSFGDLLQTLASSSGKANFNLPHGTAPSAPVNGDMWTTTAGLFVRINGSTIGPLS